MECVSEDLFFGDLDDGVEVLLGRYFFELDLLIGMILVVLVEEGGDFGGELLSEVGILDGAEGGLIDIAGDFGHLTVDKDHDADEDGGHQ